MASHKTDDFVRRHLPDIDQWPDILLPKGSDGQCTSGNCVSRLLDHWLVQAEWRQRPCIVTDDITWSYEELAQRVNQLAQVLVQDLGLIPGNRVLLRAPNTPMMVCAYLAVIKAGAVAVGTMPLLRAIELQTIINKAEISHALCDTRLAEELAMAAKNCPVLQHVLHFQSAAAGSKLAVMMAVKSTEFSAWPAAADDPCLIAFTSGTTGQPKGTVHFHRDLLLTCSTYAAEILAPTADDLFTGSPPIAFTFGLGGLVLFPLYFGASTLLLESTPPAELVQAIKKHSVSIVFTAPTAYRAMLESLTAGDLNSVRKAVSAGEHLPLATWQLFYDKTGIRLLDGIGATEMLHIFIAAREDEIKAGATGKVVPGYEAKIVDSDFNTLENGAVGRLAVRGPTGCRYLADERQNDYVKQGWNLTGDAYSRDDDGYYWFAARTDDMIISSGYNIAGPEVENALLAHPAVSECGVVGVTDEQRGQLVKAFVVVKIGEMADENQIKALQDHVKKSIAPYKYPRQIEFLSSLPKTPTGKLQRYRLREM